MRQWTCRRRAGSPVARLRRWLRDCGVLVAAGSAIGCGAGTAPSDGMPPETTAGAPGNAADPVPPARRPAEPGGVRLDTVAAGLQVPWGVDFAPDGRIFLSERTGRIRVIEGGLLREAPWAVLPVYAEDERILPESGLMGIAVDPDFARTGRVCVVGTFWKLGGSRLVRPLDRVLRRVASRISEEAASPWENRVYCFTDSGGQGTRRTLLVGGLPASFYHVGGALAFGPDGMLYLSSGEALRSPSAQDPASLAGKILRYRPDGSVPDGNPVPGSAVYALGFRNPQGFVWHPETGEFFATEHGPSLLPHEGGRFGLDELNLIEAGANHGWPVTAGAGGDPRYRDPVAAWTPGIAPSGLAIYTGAFPPWRGSFFLSGLRSQQLRRVVLAHDGEGGWRVAEEEVLLEGVLGRIRAVRMGPDGHLYITTSNRDGRGEPSPGDDLLLRLVPPGGD
jgi:aldose sugar dehydrogenase